jgi:segregation and condensation protein B
MSDQQEEAKPLELENELSEEDLGNENGSDEVIDSAEIEANMSNIIEALLFASDEPLNTQNLKDILKINVDAKRLRAIIGETNKKLQTDRRPFEIIEFGGGFQYRTIPAYQKYLKGLFKDKAVRRLSGQALETLAIIAYKQPVSKAEIEAIRSVNTDSSMKTLLEKRLIKLLGKSEDKPGKPIVYGTTKDFLKYFGLNRISDLPKLEEFEEIAKSTGKTELIQDFKRDTERTETLAPAVKREDKAELIIEDIPAPEVDTEEEVLEEEVLEEEVLEEEVLEEEVLEEEVLEEEVLTDEEVEEYRIAEEAEAFPADDALPPEIDSEAEEQNLDQ